MRVGGDSNNGIAIRNLRGSGLFSELDVAKTALEVGFWSCVSGMLWVVRGMRVFEGVEGYAGLRGASLCAVFLMLVMIQR